MNEPRCSPEHTCIGVPWPQVQAIAIVQSGSLPKDILEANIEMIRQAGMIKECMFHPGNYLTESDPIDRRLADRKLTELQSAFAEKYWSKDE